MPLRSLSPDQLFDSLIQATGARNTDGPNLGEGGARGRFLELFANRDERPTEGQTSILQALSMMNGSLIAVATGVETGDTLAAVAEAPFLDAAGKVESLYLAALTRRPRPDELAAMVAYVEEAKTDEGRARALSDIFWAMLNSPEFRFNH
jgi:hypothetical protein